MVSALDAAHDAARRGPRLESTQSPIGGEPATLASVNSGRSGSSVRRRARWSPRHRPTTSRAGCRWLVTDCGGARPATRVPGSDVSPHRDDPSASQADRPPRPHARATADQGDVLIGRARGSSATTGSVAATGQPARTPRGLPPVDRGGRPRSSHASAEPPPATRARGVVRRRLGYPRQRTCRRRPQPRHVPQRRSRIRRVLPSFGPSRITYQQKLEHVTVLPMAKSAPYADEADYVVVGSGSSGAAIAGRLAESGASVIVVEAGKSDDQFLVKKPGMIGPMHSVPEIKERVDWGFYSVPQKHLLDRKMPVPRGKVVGGSSSINGMVYVRGNRANYDSWAAEGNTGWDADTRQRGVPADGGLRGRRQRLPRRRRPDQGDPQQDAAGGLAPVHPGRLRHPRREDPRRLQRGVAGGRQPDAAERRRRPALLRLPRLHPPPQAAAASSSRARRWSARWSSRTAARSASRSPTSSKKGGGAQRTIRAGKEVILSAGFVGSAQLLMLSGIGHAQHLRDHGIDVVADLPVGDNLHDHLFHALTFHVTTSQDARQRVLLRQGRGQGGGPAGQVVHGQHASSRPSRSCVRRRPTDVPDLQLHLLPWSYVSPNQDEPIRHDVDPRTSITVLSTLIYPRSRGTLRLASRRPDGRAADRLPVPRRPGRPRGARRGLGDGPRDHGRRGVRRRGQGGAPPRRQPQGPGAARRDPQPGHVGLPRRRHLPDGRRRARRRRPRPARSAASRGCASATPRSCRRSPAATPTRPRS